MAVNKWSQLEARTSKAQITVGRQVPSKRLTPFSPDAISCPAATQDSHSDLLLLLASDPSQPDSLSVPESGARGQGWWPSPWKGREERPSEQTILRWEGEEQQQRLAACRCWELGAFLVGGGASFSHLSAPLWEPSRLRALTPGDRGGQWWFLVVVMGVVDSGRLPRTSLSSLLFLWPFPLSVIKGCFRLLQAVSVLDPLDTLEPTPLPIPQVPASVSSPVK